MLVVAVLSLVPQTIPAVVAAVQEPWVLHLLMLQQMAVLGVLEEPQA